MLYTARLDEEDVAALRTAERVRLIRWAEDAVDVDIFSSSPVQSREIRVITAEANGAPDVSVPEAWHRTELLLVRRGRRGRGWSRCGLGWSSTLQGEFLEVDWTKRRPQQLRLLSRAPVWLSHSN